MDIFLVQMRKTEYDGRMQKRHDVCLVGGCGKASHGKQYCVRHMNVGQRRTLTTELSAVIRSDCCSAKCVRGKPHENGEQYCTKCEEPCCWKTHV